MLRRIVLVQPFRLVWTDAGYQVGYNSSVLQRITLRPFVYTVLDLLEQCVQFP
jgi:hypothetical protein